MTDDEVQLSARRHNMVVRQLRRRGIDDPALLEAFERIPRHRFVPPKRRWEAYEDRPISIGSGQTISQPYIVALMIRHLEVRPEHVVLDVGAGSGYQTAILAQLARHVRAIERVPELAERAREALAELGIENVSLVVGDGSLGWPADSREHAPGGPTAFDRIICGAGAPELPSAWVEQLADGGRIVLPAGPTEHQRLYVIDKRGERLERRELCDVRFVPLIGEEGWPNR